MHGSLTSTSDDTPGRDTIGIITYAQALNLKCQGCTPFHRRKARLNLHPSPLRRPPSRAVKKGCRRTPWSVGIRVLARRGCVGCQSAAGPQSEPDRTSLCEPHRVQHADAMDVSSNAAVVPVADRGGAAASPKKPDGSRRLKPIERGAVLWALLTAGRVGMVWHVVRPDLSHPLSSFFVIDVRRRDTTSLWPRYLRPNPGC